MSLENPTTLDECLDSIYSLLPKSTGGCPAKCCKCCGPVAFTKTEAKRMGVDRMFSMTKGQHGDTCEFVDDATGGCSVYENRPFTCRLFNSPYGGVFKCNETPESGRQHPNISGNALEAYFGFIELEGTVKEFLEATDKVYAQMKQREQRNGWESRYFGIKNPQ